MAFLSHAKKEIKAKIVYYGPGLSGKTSNVEYIFKKMRSDHRGDLVNLSTSDRTLFFDFLPVELGNIKGYRTRFHIFTVPGQVFYNETRKTVLLDVDGIVFVADSQKKMRDENQRSLKNLEENLSAIGKKLIDIPHVFQYNKRDMPDIMSLEELHRLLNKTNAPFFEAVATTGNGILTTLKLVSKMVLKKLATAPAGTLEENDAAFEEKNYGLSNEYQVVSPGDEVEDNESVVHAVEVDIPMGDVMEQAEAAIMSGRQMSESYEADIPAQAEEDDIPPPPPHEEIATAEHIEEAETVHDAEPAEAIAEAAPEIEIPIPVAELSPPPAPAPIAAPKPVAQAPAPVVQAPPPASASAPAAPPVAQAAPLPRELVIYQWGFPERVGNNSIKIPLYFKDSETRDEYWTYVTICLDNILKR